MRISIRPVMLYIVLLVVPGATFAMQPARPQAPASPRKETPPTKTEEPPSTATAAPSGNSAPKKVDRSSPKPVVLAFATALATGDRATARSLVVGTPKQLEYVEAQVADYQATIRFDRLLKRKFGEEADWYLDHYEKLGQYAQKAEIEMDGADAATASIDVEDGDGYEEWGLVRRNGQWSIDANSIWDPTEDPDDGPEVLRKHAKVTIELTKQMAAGKFSSAEAAVEAWNEQHDEVDEEGA